MLVRVLSAAELDPNLKDLAPLGWFIAHAQTGITLTAPDLAVYNGFFPDPWQVTLVLRRQEGGSVVPVSSRAISDGKLKSDASYSEFRLEPLRRGGKPAPSPAVAAPAVESRSA